MSHDNHTPQGQWWKTSGAFALLVAIVVGISFSLPRDQGITVIVIGIVAFALALFFNPR